ncbi:hypothetical protein vseg_008093 [Gypsophila vaccaria]
MTNDHPPKSHTPNPLYALTSNDGPGTKITHVVLRGPNYEEWAKGFRVSLGAKRKLGFINGNLVQPKDDSPDLEDWWTTNYMIVAWIFSTIDPSIRSTISYRDTAKELWDDIRQRFSLGNGIKVFQLKSEIVEWKQKDDETIMDYYGRLKKLWDDINDFDALPSCFCSGCKCGLNEILRKRWKTNVVREFLMGLEPYYATVRSNILGIDPLPSIHTVYSRLVQEEEVSFLTQRKIETPSLMTFAAKGSTSRPSNRGGVTRSKCTYCSKLGHLEDRCWEKHGYPEGRGPKRIGSGPIVAANNVTTLGEVSATANNVRLNGKDIHTWIVDTGASTHICCDTTLFDSYRSISPIHVGLPNGTRTVRINECLVLTNVLFVPNFNYNLLSVSQLLSAQRISIQFTNTECVIQDLASMMRIGVGRLLDGLYFLEMGEPVHVNVVTRKETNKLWHQRLGHPSMQAMEHLPDITKNKSNSDFLFCDICVRAKQTRSTFPLSNNKASLPFELLHCDVWGPYRPNRACNSRYFLTIVDDFSRCLWVYLMKTKDEVSRLLIDFFALVDRQFERKVKIVRSDNGTKFGCLDRYFLENGIIHQTSIVKTPQQNARVERKHRHILNVARALHFQGCLPVDFWGECVLTAAFLINRTPTRVLDGKTLYELLYGRAPNLASLRVFGCLCYAKNLTPRDKFDTRSLI